MPLDFLNDLHRIIILFKSNVICQQTLIFEQNSFPYERSTLRPRNINWQKHRLIIKTNHDIFKTTSFSLKKKKKQDPFEY